MNLPKSSRYHRAKRRAEGVAGLLTLALLSALVLTPASVTLRTLSGGSVAAYAGVLLVLPACCSFPCRPIADIGSSGSTAQRRHRGQLAGWADEGRPVRIGGRGSPCGVRLLGDALAGLLVGRCRWRVCRVVGLLTAAGPVLFLPLLHRSRPLARDELRHRLERLSARAGVPVLGVHELPLGERSRRASAALVGAGSTRRILLSDTLLANYSDDEIEVVMAHEMGHHVHRHMLKTMAVEVLLLLAGFRLASAALEARWRWLGLSSRLMRRACRWWC